MNGRVFDLLISLTVLACLVCTLQPTCVVAAPRTLTYVAHHPEADIHSQLIKEWIREVESRTNGKISIQFYPAETKVSGPQTYNAVQHGYVDIGFSVMQYTRGRFPLMDFIGLPLGFSNGQINTAIINEVYEKFQPDEFASVKVIYLMSPGAHYLHTKKQPVTKASDWQNKKIHYLGDADQIITTMGGTPVSLPMGKLFDALLDDKVEGGTWDFSAGQHWNFAEVAKYDIICDPIAFSTGLYVIMNKQTWESLDDDIKKVIDQLSPIWAAKHGEAWEKASQRGLAYSKSLGNEIITVEPQEAQAWKEEVQPVIDNYINKTQSKGIAGQEVIDYARKRLQDAKAGSFSSPYLGKLQ